MPTQALIHGDCLDVFKTLPFRLQAIVADPPAGIGFMGRRWDKHRPESSYNPPIAPRSKKHLRELQERHAFVLYWAPRFAAAYDACEDDATALIWALPRTSDWTAEAMRLAGWRIQDVITHHFGSGFPKGPHLLKPGSEHWILGYKGSLKTDIDACKIERGPGIRQVLNSGRMGYGGAAGYDYQPDPRGGWPANVLLSHAETCLCVGARKVNASGLESVPVYHCAVECDCGRSWTAEAGGDAPRCECGALGWWACPVAEMDAQSGQSKSLASAGSDRLTTGSLVGSTCQQKRAPRPEGHSDEGGASRFFARFGYYGKAPSGEKHAGCEGLHWRRNDTNPFGFDRIEKAEWDTLPCDQRAEGNVHPTVKRISLMRWLHRLTGAQRIGDMCAGSGSGMIAALMDGLDWVGAETCPEAIEIAQARYAFWSRLTPAMIAEYTETEIVPVPPSVDSRQMGLF